MIRLIIKSLNAESNCLNTIITAHYACNLTSSFNNQQLQNVEKSLTALDSLGWRIINPITKTLACNVVGIGAMAHVKDIVSHIEKIVTDWEKLEVEKYSDGNASRTLPTKNRRSSGKEEAVRKEQRTFLQWFWSEALVYFPALYVILLTIVKECSIKK